MPPIAILLYIVVALLYGAARFVEDWTGTINSPLEWGLKPLLMPLLMVYVYQHKHLAPKKEAGIMLCALLFALGGDSFLMFAKEEFVYGKLYFILGLGSFLVMQILYIILYNRTLVKDKKLLAKYPLYSIPVLLVATIFAVLAIPKLKGIMLVAVPLYAISLSSMVLFAMNRYGGTTTKSFQAVVLGASLFMLSDLMIGINRFIYAFPFASFSIIITYIVGQYYIVQGYINSWKPTKS